jgi:hypothetical protein
MENAALSTTTYLIPAGNYGILESRIADIARRAARLVKRGALADATPIGVEKLETVIKPGKGGDPDAVFYRVRVTGAAPKLAGWSFVATLQHEEGGTVLRTVPTATLAAGELNRFRDVAPECHHCNSNRRRNDTFVVRSDAGELKQVGRNCLAAFLGGLSPNAAASMAEILAAAGEACGAAEGGEGGGGEYVGTLADFLVYTAASIRLNGWVSRAKSIEWDKTATATNVWCTMFPGNHPMARAAAEEFRRSITDADRKLAANALAYADENLTAESAASDYEHNLRVVVVGGIVKHRVAGIAASLIGWYERAMGVKRERTRTAASIHVGTVGKREVFTVTLAGVHSFETHFGVTHLYRFEDTAGNVLVWKASSAQDMERGSTYKIKGTVKEHGEYKGTKQTVLTRCAVVGKVESVQATAEVR